MIKWYRAWYAGDKWAWGIWYGFNACLVVAAVFFIVVGINT